MSTPVPSPSVSIASLPNLRDIGGYATSNGGRVTTGLVYRSVHLHDLHPDDLESFAELGIRTVFDLRTDPERVTRPNPDLAGTTQVVLDVLSVDSDEVLDRLDEIVTSPELALRYLGDGQGAARVEAAYRRFVLLPTAVSAYRALLLHLAHAPHEPALLHCTSGKDRTGWAAALLLLVLGVSRDDVMQDYLRTNDELLPARQPMIDRFVAAGGDADLLAPVLGVREAYLAAALDELTSGFGSVEGYVRDGLGIDDTVVTHLREAYVSRG